MKWSRFHLVVLGLWMAVPTLADVTDSLTSTLNDSIRRGSWAVEVAGNASYMLHGGPYNKRILHSYGTSYYDVRLKWQAAPDTRNAYDQAWNRPKLEAGVACGDFSHVHIYGEKTPYESKIGQMWTLYAGVQVDFLRKNRWDIGVSVQNGAGVCLHPYDENKNVDQEVIGSALSIYVAMGIYGSYRLSPRWSVSASLDFRHYSNGTLDRPNLGANTIGPTLAVSRSFTPQPLRQENVHTTDYECNTITEGGVKSTNLSMWRPWSDWA